MYFSWFGPKKKATAQKRTSLVYYYRYLSTHMPNRTKNKPEEAAWKRNFSIFYVSWARVVYLEHVITCTFRCFSLCVIRTAATQSKPKQSDIFSFLFIRHNWLLLIAIYPFGNWLIALGYLLAARPKWNVSVGIANTTAIIISLKRTQFTTSSVCNEWQNCWIGCIWWKLILNVTITWLWSHGKSALFGLVCFYSYLARIFIWYCHSSELELLAILSKHLAVDCVHKLNASSTMHIKLIASILLSTNQQYCIVEFQ